MYDYAANKQENVCAMTSNSLPLPHTFILTLCRRQLDEVFIGFHNCVKAIEYGASTCLACTPESHTMPIESIEDYFALDNGRVRERRGAYIHSKCPARLLISRAFPLCLSSCLCPGQRHSDRRCSRCECCALQAVWSAR